MTEYKQVNGSLPATMRVLGLHEYGGELQVLEKPTPRPGPGEVVVRIAAAPINPSDLAFIRGDYALKKALPAVPGFEGSGTVVAAGPGLVPRLWLGRSVSCSADPNNDGTWAEYMLTKAMSCMPLPSNVNLEQGSMALVNPLTAWALLDIARRGNHRAIANTAAASALGRMLLRLANRYHYPVLHIVNREAQVDLLHDMGAEHVLNNSAPDFEAQLAEAVKKLNVTLAYDAVGGKLTGQLMNALPIGGRVTVYGALSLAESVAHPGTLIFEGKHLDGFWLSSWLTEGGISRFLRAASAVRRLLDTDLSSTVQARLPLERGPAGLALYEQEMTRGKVLIMPGEMPV